MSGTSWLPRREQNFVDLCLRWKIGLEDPANVAAFGWDPAEVAVVLVAIDAFVMARMAYEQDNSTRNRLIKDEAKDATEHVMEDFANTSIRYNKLMKEENKQYYGIHTPDPIPTPNPRPTTPPRRTRRLSGR
jgi:hypothetical protein